MTLVHVRGLQLWARQSVLFAYCACSRAQPHCDQALPDARQYTDYYICLALRFPWTQIFRIYQIPLILVWRFSPYLQVINQIRTIPDDGFVSSGLQKCPSCPMSRSFSGLLPFCSDTYRNCFSSYSLRKRLIRLAFHMLEQDRHSYWQNSTYYCSNSECHFCSQLYCDIFMIGSMDQTTKTEYCFW